MSGKCDSIIQFHQKQPKGPGFHRHPPGHVVEEVVNEVEHKEVKEKEEEKVSKVAPSRPVRKGRSAAAVEEKMKEKLEEKSKEEEEKDVDQDLEEGTAEEEEKPRGTKRKSIRVGASEVAQPSPAKKKKGGSQKNQPVPPKDPSPQPFLRSSRRLRRMKNPSPSPPPPPPSDPSESEKEDKLEEEDKSKSTPSPPPSSCAPAKANVRITRASRRLASARQQQVSASTSVALDSKAATKSPLSKRETSPETLNPQEKAAGRTAKVVSDESKGEDVSRDNDEASDSDLYKSPVTRSPENPPSQPTAPPINPEEEDNYTICHGTPQNSQAPSRHNDMSSPREWQSGKMGLQQQPQHPIAGALHQQQHQEQQYVIPFQQQPKPQESFGSPGSDQILSPDAVTAAPNRGGASFGTINEERRGEISSAGHTSSEYHPHMPLPPQYALSTSEQFYPKDWGVGSRPAAPAAYSVGGMPGGYPGMYGHPMQGIPYGAGPGAPPSLAAARSNYPPYPMSYSWGPTAAIHHHHQLQQQGGGGAMSSAQHRQMADRMQGRLPVMGGGGGAEFSSHGHTALPAMQEKRKSYSDSPSTSPGAITAGSSTMQPRPPPPNADRTSSTSLRVGGAASSSSGSREISQHQLAQHGLHPPGMAAAHSTGPHEHLPPHAFPYPFEPTPSLHMWQQSQIHAHRPISGMHPAAAAHLPPGMGPPGIWYGPPGTQIHPHLIQGQEIHAAGLSGGKKGAGAKGKRDTGGSGEKSSSNRNNSNNSNVTDASGLFQTSHGGTYGDVSNQSNVHAVGRENSGFTSQQMQHQNLAPNVQSGSSNSGNNWQSTFP